MSFFNPVFSFNKENISVSYDSAARFSAQPGDLDEDLNPLEVWQIFKQLSLILTNKLDSGSIKTSPRDGFRAIGKEMYTMILELEILKK